MIGRTVRSAIRAIALRILRRRMKSRESFRAELTVAERAAVVASIWPLITVRVQDEMAMTPLDVAMIDAVAGEDAGEIRIAIHGDSAFITDERGTVVDIWLLGNAEPRGGVR